jgi:hypothetical protein
MSMLIRRPFSSLKRVGMRAFLCRDAGRSLAAGGFVRGSRPQRGKPADRPVELPTKYELVLNLRVFEGSMVRQMLDKDDHDRMLTVEHRFLVV